MVIARYMTLLVTLTLYIGACADHSGRVAGVDQTTVRGPQGAKLTLIKPGGVTIERGKAESVIIRLRRDDVPQDVRVSITELPKGVEAVDSPRNTSSDSVEVVLRASDNADLVKNHQALVSAEGPGGMRANEKMEITVRNPS